MFKNVFLELPFGTVPAMEWNGQMINQSLAIARLIAREYGLDGKTNLESAMCDVYGDCTADITNSKLPI